MVGQTGTVASGTGLLLNKFIVGLPEHFSAALYGVKHALEGNDLRALYLLKGTRDLVASLPRAVH